MQLAAGASAPLFRRRFCPQACVCVSVLFCMALTTPATTPAPADAQARTWPCLSSDRHEGLCWYTRLLRAAAPCSGDAARFAAGLGL